MIWKIDKGKSKDFWMEADLMIEGNPRHAIVKWDGCIHYTQPDEMEGQEQYWHFCGGIWGIETEIRFLQELLSLAREYFTDHPTADNWKAPA